MVSPPTPSTTHPPRSQPYTTTDPINMAEVGYGSLGNVVTSTDARGQTVAYTYDRLGRRTALRDDSPSGVLRAQWSYDTVAKGQLTSSVRFEDGEAYTTTVIGYCALL